MRTPKPRAAHSKDATASVKSIVASLAERFSNEVAYSIPNRTLFIIS
jgi:hypothetical protein